MNAMTPGAHNRLLAQLATIPACQIPNQEADWFPPVDILEDAEEFLRLSLVIVALGTVQAELDQLFPHLEPRDA